MSWRGPRDAYRRATAARPAPRRPPNAATPLVGAAPVEPAAAAEEAWVTALEALEVTEATSLLREASWEETRAEMEERAPPLTVESS